MTHGPRTLRRLLVALAIAGLVGASSVGAAGAIVISDRTSGVVTTSPGVEKCVTVTVPGATVKVNAKLKVKAAGVRSGSRSSTTVSTGPLRTVRVCVQADADAQITLNADLSASLGSGGSELNVAAQVVARTAVNVKVTANGVRIL